MYTEDLAVLGRSFIDINDFYSLINPSSPDLGPAIKEFFDGSEGFGNCEILRLMCWANMEGLFNDDRLKREAKKIQDYNIEKIRKLLRECKDFWGF